MGSNQYIKYIEAGLSISPSKRQFRKIALGPFLLVLLMGVIPCVVLGGYWLILLSIMLVTSIAMTLLTFIFSSKSLTTMNQLIIQSLIYSNWFFQIVMLQTMFYLIVYGVNFKLILIYMPPLITPLVLGLRNAKYLRLGYLVPKKRTPSFVLSFAWSGIIGICLAKSFFQQLTNETAMVFVMMSFTFLSCVFSIGLLSYQRIYYLKKHAVLSD